MKEFKPLNKDSSIILVEDRSLAVEALATDQPDPLILDIMLPRKDGMTICRKVRPNYSGYMLMLTAR